MNLLIKSNILNLILNYYYYYFPMDKIFKDSIPCDSDFASDI